MTIRRPQLAWMPVIAMVTVLALLYSPAVFAQDEIPASQTGGEDETQATLPDQEVEINEDNYRQFMELKDDLRQRTVTPEDSYESRAAMQKLDKLPEASQKHLRNQLREIIVEEGGWQPGDENKDYPYLPSDAARGNASLQKQEAEAWGELMDNYHAREAQIHANSARTRAAIAGASAMSPDGSGEADGEGKTGQGQQASELSQTEAGGEADSYAPAAQAGSNAQGNEGVSQSAMEFLQNTGYGTANETGMDPASSEGADQAGEGQELASQPNGGLPQVPAINAATVSRGSREQQPAEGVSQNAMEFLQQAGQQDAGTTDAAEQGRGHDAGGTGQDQAGADGQQAGEGEQSGEQQQDPSRLAVQDPTVQPAPRRSVEIESEGVSQNAFEYLSGDEPSATAGPGDTLTIEDLLKAKGVAVGVGADVPPDEDNPDQDKPDKGGG